MFKAPPLLLTVILPTHPGAHHLAVRCAFLRHRLDRAFGRGLPAEMLVLDWPAAG